MSIGAIVVWGLAAAAIAADLWELYGVKPNVTLAAQGIVPGAFESDLPDHVIKNLTTPMRAVDRAWIAQAQAEARAANGTGATRA